MRIIAGKFRARKLASFDAQHIRPTTDRVKESLFNILGPLDGGRVLDLFSGTGSLGLEAYSRGAQTVEMVERHPQSIKIIVKNIDLLKIEKGVAVHKADVISFLKAYKGDPFDVILIDPPFPSKICRSTLEALSDSEACSIETITAIEHSRHEPLPEKIGRLGRVDSRDYGDKLVSFFKAEV